MAVGLFNTHRIYVRENVSVDDDHLHLSLSMLYGRIPSPEGSSYHPALCNAHLIELMHLPIPPEHSRRCSIYCRIGYIDSLIMFYKTQFDIFVMGVVDAHNYNA